MRALARAFPPAELARRAYELYESFRPTVPEGLRGWGAAGTLDLDKIEAMARAARTARSRVMAANHRRRARLSRGSEVPVPG